MRLGLFVFFKQRKGSWINQNSLKLKKVIARNYIAEKQGFLGSYFYFYSYHVQRSQWNKNFKLRVPGRD